MGHVKIDTSVKHMQFDANKVRAFHANMVYV